jgi:hypothetical protein
MNAIALNIAEHLLRKQAVIVATGASNDVAHAKLVAEDWNVEKAIADLRADGHTPRLTVERTGIVNTYELRVGEAVVSHGEVFRLIARVEAADCVWFRTEHLGYISDYRSMPADWRADWTIQGNDRARWSRVNVVTPA